MQEQYLTVWDLVLTPIYLGILTFIAKRYRDKHYKPGNPLRKYYLPGLYVKFFGVIFIALIYQYYYGEGDTFNYFRHSQIINSSLNSSTSTWIKLILRFPVEQDPKLYPYVSRMNFYNDPSAYIVSVIGAVLGLLNGTTYLPIGLLFAYFSYTGIWALYRTFVNLYPKEHKPLALAFIFIPSTFVWGSAIFKDTICMFALGWMTFSIFRVFIQRDFSLKNIFLFLLSAYLIFTIKIYILIAFLPALTLWILLKYSSRISIPGIRYFVALGFVVVNISALIFFAKDYSKELQRYSLDKIIQTSTNTRQWIYYASGDEGSKYDLGQFDPSLTGFLSKFPAGVNVTLFRPYLWEASKPIIALSAIESFVFFVFTILILIRSSGKAIGWVFSEPTILFCFIFSIFFAFAVGISSYNFGALSRYKIPCLPFYAAMLVILNSKVRNLKKNSRKIKAVYHNASTNIEIQLVPKL